MNGCSDIRQHLWAYLDGDLAPETAAEVERHLAACPACRREAESRRRLWDILALDAVPDAPDLSQRIMNQVVHEGRRAPREHRWWPVWAAVAAAAGLILALSLPLIVGPSTTPHNNVKPPEVEVAAGGYLDDQLVSVESISDIELLVYGDYLESLVPEQGVPDDI